MQSVSEPLNRLQEDGSWFTRAHEVRFLLARTSGDLRSTVLKLLPMFEFHADNFSPWVVFEDARSPENDGWQTRANRLRENWELRRQAFAKEQITLPELRVPTPGVTSGGPPASAPAQGFLTFQQTAAAVLGALRPPLKGLVLVLAPALIDDSKALEAELMALIDQPLLGDCRVVLVQDVDVPRPERLFAALGERALETECAVDPDAMDQDLEAMLGAGSEEKPQVAIGAGPRGVVPPPRVDDPPEIPLELRDQALKEAGINPEYLEKAPVLRNLVLGAALAMKKGQGPEAVQKQRQARDLCEHLELHEMRLICQIGLASYLSGLGRADLAIKELTVASDVAQEHELWAQKCQANLALGLLHALARRLLEAARAYVEAARAAQKGGIELLEIEGWRLAAQIAMQAGNEKLAFTWVQEAIRVARGSDPNLVKESSAAEAVRSLAALCKKRGMQAQAVSLFEHADMMEQGLFGKEVADSVDENEKTVVTPSVGKEEADSFDEKTVVTPSVGKEEADSFDEKTVVTPSVGNVTSHARQ